MVKEQVTVVGAGIIGSATGRALAEVGHEIDFVDVNPQKVENLQREGFSAALEIGSRSGGIFMLSVPTPSVGTGYDLSIIETASRSVGAAISNATEPVIVVTRSTVAPGFSDRSLKSWIEESSGREVGDDLALVSAPEFLREVSATEDARHPWISVVGGSNAGAVSRVLEMFAPLGGAQAVFPNATSAEMVKIVHNCYNAAKISFWNEIAILCDSLEIDQIPIGEVVAQSAEASFNPAYGIKGGRPYGGACLPKDLEGLIGFATNEGVDVPLLEAIRAVNDSFVKPRT
ncbi:MAG: 2-dehydropantoate 2-reductase N-terminal domain-containing protein [Actinomycetota bacterium]